MTADQIVEDAGGEQEGFRVADVLLAAGLLIVMLWWALETGARLEDDEARHFLQALYGWSDWRVLLDAWGRPGFTIPAAIAALFGGTYTTMRVFAALCTWGAAMGTWRGASLLGLPHGWLAPLIYLSIPQVRIIGSGAYTEPVFALALVWGLNFLAMRQFRTAALCLGWLSITRLEGALLLPLLAPFFLIQRQWIAALLLGLPMALWFAVTGGLSGDPLWVISSVPYKVNQYGEAVRGSWGHYARMAVALMGPVLLPAALLGIHVLGRRRVAIPWLVAGLGYFAIQEAAFYFAYGSAGYIRFLVAGAPVYTLFALAGVLLLAGRITAERQAIRLAQTAHFFGVIVAATWYPAALPPVLAICVLGWLLPVAADWLWRDGECSPCVLPLLPCRVPRTVLAVTFLLLATIPPALLHPEPQERVTFSKFLERAAVAAKPRLEAQPGALVISTNFEFHEYLGTNPFDTAQVMPSFSEGGILALPPGSLILWDSLFGKELWRLDKGWFDQEDYLVELVHQRNAAVDSPEVRLYIRTAVKDGNDLKAIEALRRGRAAESHSR